MNEGPSAGLRWVYFVSPWGMTMELVSYPRGMAYRSWHQGHPLETGAEV